MEDKKENIRGPVPRLYSSDMTVTPKKVALRVGPNLSSGKTFDSFPHDGNYKEIPVNNILIKNKDNHYANFFDAQSFVSTNLMALPMLLRKCWQSERQALKSKNNSERVIMTGFATTIVLFVVLSSLLAYQTERWLPPLNNVEMIRALCTESMHKHVMLEVQQMRDEQASAMSDPDFTGVVPRAPIMNILKHNILCRKNFREVLIDRRYEGIIWFMRSLDFCDINKIALQNPNLQYHRDFQIDMLRAGYALICQKTDDIGKYQLNVFADLFRIIYEKSNVNRPIICNKLVEVYQDVYERCHIDSTQANITVALMRCQGGNDVHPLIKLRSFFSRFSRSCQTLTEFYQNGDRYDTHLGEALANDTVFMNMLSSHIKRTTLDYSLLPHLVLKTRLLLQHFPLAAIKTKQLVEAGRR